MKQSTVDLSKALTERCCISFLGIKQFGGNIMDRKTTGEIKADRNSMQAEVKVTQHLFKHELKPIQQIVRYARTVHEQWTFPYPVPSGRLCPNQNVLPMTLALKQVEGAYIEERDRLAGMLDEMMKLEVQRKQGFFNESLYPTRERFLSRFTWTHTRMPMPTESVIKALKDVPPEMLKEWLAEQEVDTGQRAEQALRHAWSELHGVLHRIASSVGDEESGFKYSGHYTGLVKLAEVAAVLPGMNIVGDPTMDRLAGELRTLIAGVADVTELADPALAEQHLKDLRHKKNEALRQKIGEKARELAAEASTAMADYF